MANTLIDFGVPLGDRGYAKTIFCGNATGLRYTSKGESYESPVQTLFGTAGSNDGAIAKCDSSDLGTRIFVRRGHAENIAIADVASDQGARKRIHIIGEGDETERPTFTFTAAAATWLLDTDSIIIENCNINLESGDGGVTVAAPMTISGNGCGLKRCKIRAGTDVNNKVTVGITVTGADCFMEDVFLYSATAAEATTFLRLTAAPRFRARKLRLIGATSAVGVGSMQILTTAVSELEMDDCYIANRKAASTTAVSGLAATTGQVRYSHLHVLANTATELTGAWATKASVQFEEVKVTNDLGEVAASLLPLSV